MKRIPIYLAALAAAFLCGCSAVRHCKSPELNLPETLSPDQTDSTTVADVAWWRFYGDSILCNIIRHTLANNKDMLAAAARVERMRQLYRIGKAERLPSVTGTAYGDYVTPNLAPRLP